MEKKEYSSLEMEIVRFDTEDVIVTSGDEPTNNRSYFETDIEFYSE